VARRDRLKLIAAVFGLLASLAGSTQIISLIAAGQNDFVPFYVSGREAVGGDVYDSASYYDFTEKEFSSRPEWLAYIRPPFYALLFKPLAALDYQTAHWCWIGLRLLAVAAFLWLFRLPTRIDAVLAVCVSAPLASSLMNGQDIAVLLVVVALALRMEKAHTGFLAGAVLSLCAIKFHLFFPLPLLIFSRQRRDLAAGFFGAGVALVGLSFVAAGPTWPIEYIETLTQSRISPSLQLMPNIHGLVGNMPCAIWLEVGFALAVLGACWWVFRRATFEISVALSIVAGFLISYHSYGHDGAILIPAALIFLARMESLAVKAASLALLFPLTWMAPAVPIQTVMIFLFLAVLWEVRSVQSPTAGACESAAYT